jgi:DNA-binding response OmpR family regulator
MIDLRTPERATDTNPLSRSEPLPRILVVTADDDTRALYGQSFQESGCHVIEASDGRDALTKALASPPSLVVSETGLPFLDGYALCEILRRDRATAGVPVLIVTAEGRPAEMVRARDAGADIVVAEPTTPQHIVSLSRRLISGMKGARNSTAATMAGAAAPREISENAVADFEERRTAFVEVHSRFSATTPARPPFSLICPQCERPLTYHRSHIGGVNDRHLEQWDYYTCPACGIFQYRQRTRTLRRVDALP